MSSKMLFVQNELHFITFCAKRVFIKDGYCPVCIAFRCAFELFCACHFVNKRHRNQKYRVVGKLNNSALKYLLRFLFSDGNNNNCTCCQKNYKSGNNDKQRIERIAA